MTDIKDTLSDVKIDPLFEPDDRSTFLPIKYPTIVALLNQQRGCFWQTHEVSLAADVADWQRLSSDEQFFLKRVLAFFAHSDLIVNKNLEERFIRDVTAHEIQALYHFQEAMEDIHSEMYALLIDTYIRDPIEKKYLFDAIKTITTIAKKAEWAERWISSDEPYENRLIAMSAVEGIFFSGAFCAIYWIKERGILPGLCLSNDFISRDEGLHVNSAVEIHKLLVKKATPATVTDIISSAVDLEIEFINEALPCRLIGMNAALMVEYIKYVANRHVKLFGYDEIYPNVTQPFSFMDRIGLDSKSNFFEKRPSEYNQMRGDDDEDPYGFLKK